MTRSALTDPDLHPSSETTVQPFDGFGGDAAAAARAVDLLKALSHAGRLQILCLLVDRELTVGELADALGVQQPAASQQLMRLRAEGFVTTRRDGKAIHYSLRRQDVVPVITALRNQFCPKPD